MSVMLLDQCSEANYHQVSPGLKQFAKSIWKPFKVQFADLEEQLEEQRRIIDTEIKIASEIAAHEAVQSALIYQRGGYAHREFEIRQWAENKDWQLQQDFAAKERRLKKILHSISGLDHTKSFINSRDRRHPGTGSWFLTLPEFKDWDGALDSAVLWYHGIPGSGKSILATSIIDHLYTCHRNTKSSIIYFFCDFHTLETLQYRAIVSSLLKQVIILNGALSNQLQGELEISYLNSQLPPDIYRIEDLFCTFAKQLGHLYIIIDGVDECTIEQRLDILAFLKRFLIKQPQNAKISLSTRPDIEIPKSLTIKFNISLSGAANQHDLETYIQYQLDSQCLNLGVYPTKVKEDIKEALLKGADGMFLWVYFQIHDIRRAGNKEKIDRILSDLPRGLQETYARIVHRINQERDESEAAITFKWLSECRRPLTLLELRDAIAVRVGDTHHAQIRSRYNEDPEGIIQNCCGLVILNEDQTVQYAHSTVLKYMQSRENDSSHQQVDAVGNGTSNSQENLGDASSENRSAFAHDIAELCATYLQLQDFGIQIARVQKETAVAPPKDWLKILLPGKLSFLVPVCRFAFNTIANSQQSKLNAHTVEGLTRSIYATPDHSRGLQEVNMSQFPCLNYITGYWLYHFADTEGKDFQIRASRLGALLDELSLPFPYLPGMVGSEEPNIAALLSWACITDNAPLFANLFLKSRGIREVLPTSDSYSTYQALGILGDGGDIRRLLNYAIEMNSTRIVRYILEDPPIRLRSGSSQIRKHTPLPNTYSYCWHGPYGYLYWVISEYFGKFQYGWGPGDLLEHEKSPFHTAAALGRLDIFNLLLQSHSLAIKGNVHIKVPGWYYNTVAKKAIQHGHLSIVKSLLSQFRASGSPLYSRRYSAHSMSENVPQVLSSHTIITRGLLTWAAFCGQGEAVTWLFESGNCSIFPVGQRVECCHSGTHGITETTPIGLASLDAVLLRTGPNKKSRSTFWEHFKPLDDPISAAAASRNFEIVLFLLSHVQGEQMRLGNRIYRGLSRLLIPTFYIAICHDRIEVLESIRGIVSPDIITIRARCDCEKHFFNPFDEAAAGGNHLTLEWLQTHS
ncbi:hypothetical protein TWF730_011311 [Orbilia blumenaviensis]|uniref:NACHT domain-containing protein n=1 Tax=Orbilia blumenaviensis TaxID=1796055 RepID=A0AAV9UK87_9PEZI